MPTRRSRRSQSSALVTLASTAAATATTTTVSATIIAPPPTAQDASPRKQPQKPRRRRRKLPAMSNSERAKYYRRKHAQEREELEETTVALRRHVLYLEIRLEIHRQLQCCGALLTTQRRVLDHVRDFIEDKIHHMRHGLHSESHKLVAVQLMGSAEAPVIRVRSLLRGRLTTPVIHSIYPYVLGNTIVLDKMMHQEVEYGCSYLFFYTPEGYVERESIEIDTIMALRQPLLNLSIVARVLSEVDIEVHDDDTPRYHLTPSF